MIDGLILFAVALATAIAVESAGGAQQDARIAIYVVVVLFLLVYSPVLMAREGDANGQTIGKRALGLRVVHADGGPMTLSRGLLRDGVGKLALGLVPLYTIIDILAPLFDLDNQALHDRIGRTHVVVEGTAPAASQGFVAPSHAAWSVPAVPPPPPPAPPPGSWAPPQAGLAAGPPSPPAAEPDPDPDPPDLGGFAPPVAPAPPPPPPPPAEEEDEQRGPFGPSYD